MAELGVLRTTKQALDEGLISETDFKKVRDSFVAAQQIRTGIESGIFKEEEMEAAKEKFFQLLQLHHSDTSNEYANRTPQRTTSLGLMSPAGPVLSTPPANTTPKSSIPAPPPPPPMMVKANGAAPAGRSNPPPAPPMLPMGMGRVQGSEASLASGVSTAGSSRAPSTTPGQDGGSRTPSVQMASKVQEVRNLAGIQLDQQVGTEYLRMRTRRAYRWITFRIESGVITLDQTGGSDSSHVEFAAALPEREPRYGVYDHHFMSNDGLIFNKLVFVFWCPDQAPVRLKMMYAAAKDAIKQNLDGISADVQASNDDEVSLEFIDSSVKARIGQLQQ